MELGIDYVTISDVDAKSFDKKQSYIGKPKGLTGLRKQQQDLENRIILIADKIDHLCNSGCSSFILESENGSDVKLCDPKTGECVYDSKVYKDLSELYVNSALRDDVRRHFGCLLLDDYIEEHPNTKLELETVVSSLEDEATVINKLLKDCERDIENAKRPASVEKWKLVFVFKKVNIELKGQAAKDLYEELQKTESSIDVKFHIFQVGNDIVLANNVVYEANKFVLLANDYEIL